MIKTQARRALTQMSLADPSMCCHIAGWLSREDADALLAQSLALPWIQNTFTIFGKTGNLPRREIIYGDDAYQYSYSRGKVVLTAEPWPEWLRVVRDRVESATGYKFSLVIGNRYDSGSDNIGWHDDGRPELGPNPAIASLSVGEARRFQTRPKPAYKGDRTPISTFELTHGDLITMPPGFQESHLHRIPKEGRIVGTRVNWTFRPWDGWQQRLAALAEVG